MYFFVFAVKLTVPSLALTLSGAVQSSISPEVSRIAWAPARGRLKVGGGL